MIVFGGLYGVLGRLIFGLFIMIGELVCLEMEEFWCGMLVLEELVGRGIVWYLVWDEFGVFCFVDWDFGEWGLWGWEWGEKVIGRVLGWVGGFVRLDVGGEGEEYWVMFVMMLWGLWGVGGGEVGRKIGCGEW